MVHSSHFDCINILMHLSNSFWDGGEGEQTPGELVFLENPVKVPSLV